MVAPPFEEGQIVYYNKGEEAAKIVKVHFDDELEPFFTICFLSDGREKQTTKNHLSATNPRLLQSIQDMLPHLSNNQLQMIQDYMAQMICHDQTHGNSPSRGGSVNGASSVSSSGVPSTTDTSTPFSLSEKKRKGCYHSNEPQQPASTDAPSEGSLKSRLERFMGALNREETESSHSTEARATSGSHPPQQQQQHQQMSSMMPSPSLSVNHPQTPGRTMMNSPPFEEGQTVYYKKDGETAKIVKVHFDDELEPFFTICFSSDGREKQTTKNHLSATNPRLLQSIQDMLPHLSNTQLQVIHDCMAQSIRHNQKHGNSPSGGGNVDGVGSLSELFCSS